MPNGCDCDCPTCQEMAIDWDEYDEQDDFAPRPRVIHEYSYRPPLNFYETGNEVSSVFGSDHRGPFYGIELEVETYDPEGLAEAVVSGPGRGEGLIFAKHDGSIEGVELVTHPMTFDYFSREFPFSMFNADSEASNHIGEYEAANGFSSGAGLHVHVSRAGFSSQAHTLRWLLLVYMHAQHVERIARRTSDEWCSFSDADDCEAKASRPGSGMRYSAVNAQNPDTFEVRVFRSTWDVQEFRAAVEFVAASVEYTRRLTPVQAVKGGLEWHRFRAYVASRPEYAALNAELDSVDPTAEAVA